MITLTMYTFMTVSVLLFAVYLVMGIGYLLYILFDYPRSTRWEEGMYEIVMCSGLCAIVGAVMLFISQIC